MKDEGAYEDAKISTWAGGFRWGMRSSRTRSEVRWVLFDRSTIELDGEASGSNLNSV